MMTKPQAGKNPSNFVNAAETAVYDVTGRPSQWEAVGQRHNPRTADISVQQNGDQIYCAGKKGKIFKMRFLYV